MRPKGFVIVYVLLALFLAVSLVSVTAFVRYQAALAARERGQANLAASEAGAAKGWVAQTLYGLSLSLREEVLSRLRATPPYLTEGDLAALAQEAQGLADERLCGKRFGGAEIRLFFTSRACGEPAPPGALPSQGILSQGKPVEAYSLGLTALVRAKVGDAQASFQAPGSLEVYVGVPTPAQFQLFAVAGYGVDGTPSPFRKEWIWSGKVYLAGVPLFGPRSGEAPGPVFLGPLFVGRCLGTSLEGCPGGRGNVEMVDVGSIPPEELYPSPLSPCYAPTCPRFASGVDWNAPAFGLYWSGFADESFDATGGASVYLEATSSPPGTEVRVETPGGTYVRRVEAGGSLSLRFAGGTVRVSGPLSTAAWHSDTSLTLISERDLVIEGNLRSTSPPCRSPATFRGGVPQPPDCPGGRGRGILGLVSERGDVRIGEDAPPNLTVHAAVLVPNGSFGAESLPGGPHLLNLMGSVAARNLDPMFDGRTGRGWVLQLAYDPRLEELSPPGWPRIPSGGQPAVWGVVPRLLWGDLR